MCRIELAPRLWLQGAELTITGGSSSAKHAAIWAELTAMFRCRQITALGRPVEPEVSRYLAWSSGLALAATDADFSSRWKGASPGRTLAPAITGRPARNGASRASRNS